MLDVKPFRPFFVIQPECDRFVAASDAAEDEVAKGTGGFLLLWDTEPTGREAFVANIGRQFYDSMSPGEHKIAQLELSMVLYALVARPDKFRGRRGVWYIDNVAALMCLIRGRSDSPNLERLSQLIHLALFSLQTWIYWEWVPSKSNWADAISRLGFRDGWHQKHQFANFSAEFPAIIWDLPIPAVLRVFHFV